MPTLPILLVVEREAYWLAECQRQLVGQADVRPYDLKDDGTDSIGGLRPALVILEVAALHGSLPHLVTRLSRVARVLAVIQTGEESEEWWLRELGVDAVFCEDHPRDEVLETCRRLLGGTRAG